MNPKYHTYVKAADTIAPLEKVFDPEGTFRLRFPCEDVRRIRKWIEAAGYSAEDCLDYSEVVHDEVFGKAYEFPCSLI
jgi:hypothetical protein